MRCIISYFRDRKPVERYAEADMVTVGPLEGPEKGQIITVQILEHENPPDCLPNSETSRTSTTSTQRRSRTMSRNPRIGHITRVINTGRRIVERANMLLMTQAATHHA